MHIYFHQDQYGLIHNHSLGVFGGLSIKKMKKSEEMPIVKNKIDLY